MATELSTKGLNAEKGVTNKTRTSGAETREEKKKLKKKIHMKETKVRAPQNSPDRTKSKNAVRGTTKTAKRGKKK